MILSEIQLLAHTPRRYHTDDYPLVYVKSCIHKIFRPGLCKRLIHIVIQVCASHLFLVKNTTIVPIGRRGHPGISEKCLGNKS